ncbi:MAG: Uncharacterised protein [Prochlorococcus marinus str. MIT 9313]|nr:MAG: Uncharacterised protein [Prochlorococcus marinus str. MIT 9313]
MHHRLGKHGGGSGAIPCLVFCLGCDLLNQLGTKVFKWIVKFDLFGDGDAVINDVWGAKFFLKHHVAATGADGDAHGIG